MPQTGYSDPATLSLPYSRDETMYKLHYFPDNANLAPHMLLEEIGAPYELALVDRDNNALPVIGVFDRFTRR